MKHVKAFLVTVFNLGRAQLLCSVGLLILNNCVSDDQGFHTRGFSDDPKPHDVADSLVRWESSPGLNSWIRGEVYTLLFTPSVMFPSLKLTGLILTGFTALARAQDLGVPLAWRVSYCTENSTSYSNLAARNSPTLDLFLSVSPSPATRSAR